MMKIASIILSFSLLFINSYSGSIDCVDVYSASSGTGDDDEASVSCSDYYDDAKKDYTLVSCGWNSATFAGDNMDGGYMSDDGKSCIAINGNGGDGITARAR